MAVSYKNMQKEKLVFLDTETTGNDLEKDRLCQICYKVGDEIVTKNFKPPLPISVKAMSITHITNEMVKDEESFEQSDFKKKLAKILRDKVMVAHNARFDMAMLKSEGIEIPRYICTLRLARYLDEEQEIPEYGLQYLRYYYGINIDVNPHSAEGDVLILEAIFEHLYKKAKERAKTSDWNTIIDRMVEISTKPVVIKKFNFGKYAGRKVEEIVEEDKGYLEWLLRAKENEKDEDWAYTLKHYLKLN